MADWRDDNTLGAFGSASQIPTDTWFPVDTTTGQWGTPTPTLASQAGIPDLIPTRTMAPSPVMGGGGFAGQPDQAPLSIGQVAGPAGFAPPLGPQPAMNRLARLDDLGALTPKPSVWESIARGIGMASPQGRAMLQYSDQQQQQLTNRLAARRQALSEEQETRAATQDSLNTFLKISQMPNKTMRNLMFDRYVANFQQTTGEALPADLVASFKKSSLDEGQQMAQMLEPILSGTGIKTEVAMQYLQEGGDPKNLLSLMETGLKVKKAQRDQQESQDLTQQLSTLGGVSGVTATMAADPASGTPGTSTTPPPPTARQPVAAPSQDITDAIDESSRLYPQVRKDLITAIAARESNFDPTATSPKGAQGVMQLMPGTAKEMGVEDPTDVKQNVRGGTRYFAQLLTRYHGNEALALAAYNAGPGAVDAVGGDLSKLPAETQKFVPAVLQRASAGGGATTTTAQRPDTSMMVAGPGAPAPTGPSQMGGTAQEQAQLKDLTTRIAAMDTFITANAGKGSERAKATVAAIERQRDNLAKERDRLQDRLTEVPRALAKEEALSPLRQKEAAQHGYASTQARLAAEEDQRRGQLLQDVWKDDASQFRDTKTGQAIDATQRYAEVQTQQRQGGVKKVTKEQEKRLDTVEQVLPIVQKLNQYMQAIYGPGGVYEQVSQDPEQRLLLRSKETIGALASRYPILAEADRFMKANAEGLARSLQGVRGAGTEGDVQRALQQFPNLLGSLDVTGWPPKVNMTLPDGRGVALRMMDDVNTVLNKATGLVLGNKDFRYEGLPAPLTRPEFQGPEGCRTTMERVALAPEDTVRRLRTMSPEQLRRADPALLTGLDVGQVFPALQPEQRTALQERLQAHQKEQSFLLPLSDPTEAVLPANPSLPRLTPAQITRAPEALLEGIATPQDVPGLSAEQQRALGMRLARRYMERQRQPR